MDDAKASLKRSTVNEDDDDVEEKEGLVAKDGISPPSNDVDAAIRSSLRS